MVSYDSRKLDVFTIIILAIVLAGTLPQWAMSQNCSCAANLCCSRAGYCGTGEPYCGEGCREGPCYNTVADIVTQNFFHSNVNPPASCEGSGFYTRDAFLRAASVLSRFGTVGSNDDRRREIAAFFAHFEVETTFCFVNEISVENKNYCNEEDSYAEYPCAQGRHYYGRGPLQLKWNYNYGEAGNLEGFDGLNNPDILATDNNLSFRAALWYWMVHCHEPMVLGQGFDATIRPIEAMSEKYYPSRASARITLYREYCNQLNVDPDTTNSTMLIGLKLAI